MKNILLTLVILAYNCSGLLAQNNSTKGINTFISKTHATVSVDKATNSFNFLKFPANAPLKLAGTSPAQKTLSFIGKHNDLFDTAAGNAYRVRESRKDIYGLDHVVLQQYYQQIPVYDGVLKFHFNKKGNLTSINGNRVIAGQLNTTPTVTKADAEKWALSLIYRQKKPASITPLKVNKNNLYVFQKGLAQGYKGPLHLVYEIEVRNDSDIREFLYIDAHTKELVEQFTGMHGLNRSLYETSVSPANLKWQESDGTVGQKFAALSQWQQSEVVAAGHIYNLMKNAFGHDSYDNAGAPMVTIHNNPNLPCPNASWNGITTNFCPGVASDDIVGHEWGHAYTEYTSGLIYAWQPGAINEALSDIWGETVDQLNGYFDGGESNAQRTGCASSARWRIGEQQSGPTRDMWDPNCKDNPGKVSDPLYICFDTDNGGVHLNSGVVNHAYALLVDGGTYNGQTITGLGLTKAAHIFWRAQSTHMTATTDFASLADILETSLAELTGIDLPKLATDGTSGNSGVVITAADAEQLAKVIAAVELRLENICNFEPFFKPVTLCNGASPGNAIFFENFESGIGVWTVDNAGGSASWIPRNWAISNTPPAGRTGQVAFADNFKSADCASNPQHGVLSLISPVITIPAGANSPLNLAFGHYFAIQQARDGGNLKYKIGAGPWTLVPKSAFLDNGYNTNLSDVSGNNPLKGQDVFSGANSGYVLSDWGQSQVNLTALGLLPGQTIQFRWELGTDGCDSWDGWYIDDVRIYACAAPTVQFTEGSSFIKESEANNALPAPDECLAYVEKVVIIKINQAPSAPVTVTLNTPTGTATSGANTDYTITPASFTLDAGSMSKEIIVRVYDDFYDEGNETVQLSYTLTNSPGGNASGEAFYQEHLITIVDDDIAPKGTGTDIILHADFNSGLPTGWTVLGGGLYPDTWGIWDNSVFNLDPNGHPLLNINACCDSKDKIIETSAFNTLGMSSIELSFLENFSVVSNNSSEQATIDVWDGSTWQNILTQNEATGSSGSWDAPFNRSVVIPLTFANPAMKLRFRYIGNFDDGWAIDNVKVTGQYQTIIKSSVSQTPAAQYLGPNSTAFFRDPASGELIAKIQNLSSHDYGCTTLQIDRSGMDETSWVGNFKITHKTFKVIPTNDNPAGSYQITLFYKASELPNFNGSDIKSMGKSQGGIAGATPATSDASDVVASVFYTDLAFTALFNNGFGNQSGFGLSDAPPIGNLPVKLVRFEGRRIAEGNKLAWETSSEVNNNHFVIERSENARQFYEIFKISGAGTSAIRNTYSFTDASYKPGINYYRLKQVDRDSSFAYSKIISIAGNETSKISFFPNPVQSLLNIETTDLHMKTADLKVVNSAGQCVIHKNALSLNQGNVLLDLEKLSPGIYQIIIADEHVSHCISVVKIP